MQKANGSAWVAVVLGMLALSAVADEKPPAATKPASTQSKDKPQSPPVAEKLSVTEHELKVGDGVLRYRATAGTMPIKDDAGKPRAHFFFTAYEKIGDDGHDKRPITFVFNGG